MTSNSRILVWFSCGAASAVAAKIAVERYSREAEVQVCYCDTSRDEHPDNARFLADIEKWIGQKVIRLSHPDYKSVEECWRGERYIVGAFGASCTRAMKREVREAYQRPDDRHIFGLTADERHRIDKLEQAHPNLHCLWVLADGGVTKEDCYHVLTSAGIELPAMYRLGFNNNNCVGCCKGGKGYQNKIRQHFPDVFASRAKVMRELGVQLNSGGKLYWLDELKPDEGRDVPEPPIECGIFCGQYEKLVELTK